MPAKKKSKKEIADAKIKAQIARDKRMKSWANRSTVVLGLSMAAVVLTLVALVAGPKR